MTSTIYGQPIFAGRETLTVLVAASTACLPNLSLPEAVSRLNDLEYSNIEVTVSDSGNQLLAQDVMADLEAAIRFTRDTHRLNLVAIRLMFPPEAPDYYDKFTALCKLAKAIKVVTISAVCGELGTPFNEEVERLRKLVDISKNEGARVSVHTQDGRLSEDPDTLVVLCDNVPGLGVTLDPSHFVCGPYAGRSYEKLLKYTHHTLLRDTSKEERQVRIGQGEIEYGRLVNQLAREKYQRTLCVDLAELPGIDHSAELRKLRLLLESLL